MVTFYKYWNVNPKREWVRESVAEFLGTFMLVFMGNNSVAQTVLSGGSAGNVVTIYLGYGAGLFIGVLLSAGVSGGHLNPAVTLAGAIMKKVDWLKIPHYMAAQYLGGFVAACCTYLLYMDGISEIHDNYGANLTTAGIFTTFPRPGLSILGGFIDQLLGTMVLLLGVYGIMDKKNTNVPLQLVPVYAALLLMAIGCSIGWNEGFAVNPARDLGPRFFTYLMDWGGQVFRNESFWYIPVIGPHVGALLGAGIYVTFVEQMRLNDEPDTSNDYNIQIIEKKISKDANDNKMESEKRLSEVAKGEKFTYRL